jgi:monofunctional biosynthetic peptidoglycan transglycosylase
MKKLLSAIIVMLFSGAALMIIAAAGLLMTLPDVAQLEKCFTTSMFSVEICPGSKDYVALKDISPYMIHAIIASEDTSFYSHKGFDWHEIKQSFSANLSSGHIRRGGSTITQQLAKNAFLDKDKSLWRKLKEAYLANAIEQRYDKNLILEKYLNMVEFGPSLYGVKNASRHYFSKAPAGLHPLEAAYLAHLLPNPKSYSKGARQGQLTAFNRKMVLTILKRMQSFGKLSPGAYSTAVASVGEFPWAGLSLNAFSGMPSHDLDFTGPFPSNLDDFADEETDDFSEKASSPSTGNASNRPVEGHEEAKPSRGSSAPTGDEASPLPDPIEEDFQ